MFNKTIVNRNEVINFIPLITIVCGTLGSFCNIIIFTSKKFRYNSCGFYFLCSTIFDLIYLLISGITRFILNYFPYLLVNQSFISCKCRTYLVVVTPSLSIYFLMFASIDRCLSTSTSKKWRNFSDINIAWRVAIFTLIFSFISNFHIILFFELQRKDVNNLVYNCGPGNGIYRMFFSICLLLSNPFIVYMIMFICTIITLIRIRRSRCELRFVHNRIRNQKDRDIDRHLATIIFIQVGLGMLLTFFRCGFLIYSFLTNNIKKNDSQITLDLFLDKLSLIIYYINFAKSFPVNILTSTLFRHVFLQRIQNFIRWIF
jgi:hypothetical protein